MGFLSEKRLSHFLDQEFNAAALKEEKKSLTTDGGRPRVFILSRVGESPLLSGHLQHASNPHRPSSPIHSLRSLCV